MEILEQNKCVKYQLPNGRTLDILTDVFDEINGWIQDDVFKYESGGYIVGYQHERTGNISLEKVSQPYSADFCNRTHFTIRDPRHKIFLMRQQLNQSYYMGVWHTHPENNPCPSCTDWKDWKESLNVEVSGSEYVFFLIAGIKKIRIWAGSTVTKEITELIECPKLDGVYIERKIDGID